MDAAINTGGPAFPTHWPTAASKGATLRDYFIAHAPAEPQPWFRPVMDSRKPKPIYIFQGVEYETMIEFCKASGSPPSEAQLDNEASRELWKEEFERQRYIQWPAAWADAMIAQREKAGAA